MSGMSRMIVPGVAVGTALAGTVAANQPDNVAAQSLGRAAIGGALLIPVTALFGVWMTRKAPGSVGGLDAELAAVMVRQRTANAFLPAKILAAVSLPLGGGVKVGQLTREDAFRDGQQDVIDVLRSHQGQEP
jgi:hypothetical protein